jgi:tetratricopeptide (TPR) repeat protein
MKKSFLKMFNDDEQNKQQAEEYYKIGIENAVEFKNYKKAIDYFERSVALNPNNCDGFNALGSVYSLQKQYDIALDYYQKSLLINPNSLKTLLNMANVFRNQKRYKDSIDFYNKAMSLDPNDPNIYIDIALVYGEQQNHSYSIDYLNKAISINPNDFEPYLYLALTFEKLSEFTNALDCYKKAKKNNPEDSSLNRRIVDLSVFIKIWESDCGSFELKENAKSFNCPNKHKTINKDCPFCKEFLYNLMKELNLVVNQWAKSFEIFYTHTTNPDVEIKKLYQELATSGYLNIAQNAVIYLAGFDDIFGDDFFKYPLKQWDIEGIKSVCKQFFHKWRGLTVDRCFENINPEDIRNMFEFFQYSYSGFEQTHIENLYKLKFTHKGNKENKSFAYCYSENIERLDNTPYFYNIMPYGENDKRSLLTISEKNGVVKVHNIDKFMGVSAEYTYLQYKYPYFKMNKQILTTKIIDNVETKVDILQFELFDGTEKEVVFDISGYFN